MKGSLLLAALSALLTLGCPDSEVPAEPSGGEAGAGGESGAGIICPSPDDSTVHYQTTNIEECPIEQLGCEATQFGFHNACGCGCIDKGNPMCLLDPDTHPEFISGDPAQCDGIRPACALGQTPFNNLCGCGCVDE